MANGNNPVNQDLKQLHGLLVKTNEDLSKKLGTITDPAAARAVVTEMREVVHRIDLVQSLLFKAASQGISGAVARVQAANADLASSIEDITNLTRFVTTASNFLTLVDDAIDLAKTL